MLGQEHLHARPGRFAGFFAVALFFGRVGVPARASSSGGTLDVGTQARRVAGEVVLVLAVVFPVCARRARVGGHVRVLVYVLDDARGRKRVAGPVLWLWGLFGRGGHIFLILAGVAGQSGEAGHRISRNSPTVRVARLSHKGHRHVFAGGSSDRGSDPNQNAQHCTSFELTDVDRPPATRRTMKNRERG